MRLKRLFAIIVWYLTGRYTYVRKILPGTGANNPHNTLVDIITKQTGVQKELVTRTLQSTFNCGFMGATQVKIQYRKTEEFCKIEITVPGRVVKVYWPDYFRTIPFFV